MAPYSHSHNITNWVEKTKSGYINYLHTLSAVQELFNFHRWVNALHMGMCCLRMEVGLKLNKLERPRLAVEWNSLSDVFIACAVATLKVKIEYKTYNKIVLGFKDRVLVKILVNLF